MGIKTTRGPIRVLDAIETKAVIAVGQDIINAVRDGPLALRDVHLILGHLVAYSRAGVEANSLMKVWRDRFGPV